MERRYGQLEHHLCGGTNLYILTREGCPGLVASRAPVIGKDNPTSVVLSKGARRLPSSLVFRLRVTTEERFALGLGVLPRVCSACGATHLLH